MTLVLNAPRSPQSTAAKGYQRLWNDVAHANDEAKAVQTLAGVLADKGGRTFISRLDREDAELCIEILDHVSRDVHLIPPFAPQMVSAGPRVTQPQDCREAGLLRHVEKTRWMPRTTARFHDDNRAD